MEYAKAQSDIATTEVDKMTLPKAWLSGIKELKNMIIIIIITYTKKKYTTHFNSKPRSYTEKGIIGYKKMPKAYIHTYTDKYKTYSGQGVAYMQMHTVR